MKKDVNIKKIKRDFKDIVEKAKVGLKKVGVETSVLAKRSEKELSKIANIGKAEVGILGLNIKKNQLFYELGKKVYTLNEQGKLTTKKVKKICANIGELDSDLKSKKKSMVKFMKRKR